MKASPSSRDDDESNPDAMDEKDEEDEEEDDRSLADLAELAALAAAVAGRAVEVSGGKRVTLLHRRALAWTAAVRSQTPSSCLVLYRSFFTMTAGGRDAPKRRDRPTGSSRPSSGGERGQGSEERGGGGGRAHVAEGGGGAGGEGTRTRGAHRRGSTPLFILLSYLRLLLLTRSPPQLPRLRRLVGGCRQYTANTRDALPWLFEGLAGAAPASAGGSSSSSSGSSSSSSKRASPVGHEWKQLLAAAAASRALPFACAEAKKVRGVTPLSFPSLLLHIR
jgi:hypothetical protein